MTAGPPNNLAAPRMGQSPHVPLNVVAKSHRDTLQDGCKSFYSLLGVTLTLRVRALTSRGPSHTIAATLQYTMVPKSKSHSVSRLDVPKSKLYVAKQGDNQEIIRILACVGGWGAGWGL